MSLQLNGTTGVEGLVNLGEVTATGSTTARTLANRFADVVNVRDFGAVGDGGADDTAAIQAAINFAASRNGGYVNIPSGVYKISSTLSITTSNIKIIGNGGDFIHDGGSNVDGATRIIWAGPLNGTMILIQTIQNVSNSKINGTNLIGIEFNGLGIAGIGISIISHNLGLFQNLLVQNVTQIAYKISNWVAGAIAEASDSQENIFNQCAFRMLDSVSVQNANGFYLTATTPTSSGANTSFNTFQNIVGQVYNGIGFLLDDADNNIFRQCRIFRVYDTKYAVDIRNAVCNGNAFYESAFPPAVNTIGFGGTNPNAIKLNGTSSGYTGNPYANSFTNLDSSNGTQPPVLDSGVPAYWSQNAGVEFPKNFVNTATGNDITSALLARQNTNAQYASYMYGGGDAVFGIQANGGVYSFDIPSTGLRIRKVSGSGTKTELWEDFEILSGDIYPSINNNKSCGKNGNIWSSVWAANGTIQTSDERSKKNVQDSELGLNFIKSLRPVSYKWIEGGKEIEKIVYRDADGNEVDKDAEGAMPAEVITKSISGERTHFGLLAQEVKAALPEGIDFGGWVLTDKENPDSQQALRYNQFIAPLIKAIQEQQKQIEELTAKVVAIESK